jgi:hypothetical protein
MPRLAWFLSLACSSCGLAQLEPDPAEAKGKGTSELDVGVIPYSENGRRSCEDPADVPIRVRIEGGGERGCSLETGSLGEPYWLPPTAVKYPISAEACAKRTLTTTIPFCRTTVDASTFRPLTREPSRTDLFYALLRFGDRCPPQSHPISRYIHTESRATEGDAESNLIVNGDAAAPNQFQPNLGAYVRLFFCLFTIAAEGEPTMNAFPELGYPYAVFHDFDGQQPEWVMLKRWLLTDDTDGGPFDDFHPQLTPVTEPIRSMVEFAIVEHGFVPRQATERDSLHPETLFELARVR